MAAQTGRSGGVEGSPEATDTLLSEPSSARLSRRRAPSVAENSALLQSQRAAAAAWGGEPLTFMLARPLGKPKRTDVQGQVREG